MVKDPAPIFRDSARLCKELLDRFEAEPSPHCQRICQHALSLLEQVGSALAHRSGQGAALEAADEHLLSLRIHLRLAHERGRLDDAQLFHLAEQLQGIGKQIGGWLKSLGPV